MKSVHSSTQECNGISVLLKVTDASQVESSNLEYYFRVTTQFWKGVICPCL